MRRSFPSNALMFWPLPFGSPALPPSPAAIQSMPSGPNVIMPPLWFTNGCAYSRIWKALASSASLGVAAGTV